MNGHYIDYMMTAGIGVRYKRSTCIVMPPPEKYVPLNINDPMWLHLPRWIRIEHIDTAKGRRMEHVRR